MSSRPSQSIEQRQDRRVRENMLVALVKDLIEDRKGEKSNSHADAIDNGSPSEAGHHGMIIHGVWRNSQQATQIHSHDKRYLSAQQLNRHILHLSRTLS